MHELVVSGLVRRRAELAGEVEALKARIARIAADMRQIDAVIRQFRPDFDTGEIRPKRLRLPDGAGRGEVARFIFKVLRNTPEPLTAGDLARRLLAFQGREPDDGKVPREAARRMAMALRHQELNGAVAATREPGKPVLWRIAAPGSE